MSDLRTKRTRASIKRAFMTLRAKKGLEKISVKELAELAEINKATFYLHYRDIYDLSDQIENEILEEALQTLECNEDALRDPASFVRNLLALPKLYTEAIETVFSGVRESILPDKIESVMKARLLAENPELKDNLYVEVLLSYMIQGSYRSSVKHQQQDRVAALSTVVDISHNLREIYHSHPSITPTAE